MGRRVRLDIVRRSSCAAGAGAGRPLSALGSRLSALGGFRVSSLTLTSHVSALACVGPSVSSWCRSRGALSIFRGPFRYPPRDPDPSTPPREFHYQSQVSLSRKLAGWGNFGQSGLNCTRRSNIPECELG